MKKKITAFAAGFLALAMTFTACSGGASSSQGGSGKTNIKLATGGTSGTYYAFGGVVAQVLGEKTGYKFDVQSTGASKANVGLITDGEVEMAIVQNDVMDYAYNGTELFQNEKTDGFLSMAAVYPEICQIIADPSSGIDSIADLKGKRVSVGDAGSGVEFNAKQILNAYGITFDDIQKQNLSFGDSSDAMKDNKIDAFFCTAGIPTTAVMELSSTNKIKVLGIDKAEMDSIIAEQPFYTAYVIPQSTYNGMTEDINTVAVKATFIVSKDLSEEVVYNMTKALFEGQEDIAGGHAKGAEMDVNEAMKGVSVPFHPGAEKYFKEVGVAE